MIIEKVSHTDYDRISKEHEYYLWHFLPTDKRAPFALRSMVNEEDKNKRNDLVFLLDLIQIPYFESETSESIDFLDRIGINPKIIWTKGYFAPLVVGFKRKRMIDSTLSICYCIEGVIEVIGKMDIKLLENLKEI